VERLFAPPLVLTTRVRSSRAAAVIHPVAAGRHPRPPESNSIQAAPGPPRPGANRVTGKVTAESGPGVPTTPTAGRGDMLSWRLFDFINLFLATDFKTLFVLTMHVCHVTRTRVRLTNLAGPLCPAAGPLGRHLLARAAASCPPAGSREKNICSSTAAIQLRGPPTGPARLSMVPGAAPVFSVSSILNGEDSESPARVVHWPRGLWSELSELMIIETTSIKRLHADRAQSIPALEMSHSSTFGPISSRRNEDSPKNELKETNDAGNLHTIDLASCVCTSLVQR
jgi:hypothetical protein